MVKHNITMCGSYGILHLRNRDFLFDAEDLPVIQSRSWYCDKDGYLVSTYYYYGRKCWVRFHRLIMKAKRNQFVDHINRRRYDNRKENLRCCGSIENCRNRCVSISNKSGVTGVYYDKARNKWAAHITFNGRKIFLGRFQDKEDAIKARMSKEYELFGAFAPQGGSYGRNRVYNS